MRRFTVIFERDVVTTERVTRVVEADSVEEARVRIGWAMASEFNSTCPDDTEDCGIDCQDWRPVSATAAPDDAPVDD